MNWPIPTGWTWSPIGQHVVEQVQSIGSLSPEESKRFDRLRGVSNRGGIIDPPFDRVRSIKDPSRYVVLRPGYFAYNPMRINVGSIGLVRSEADQGKISPDYVVFSTKPSLHPEYLLAFLKSDTGLQLIDHNAAGAIRQRLYYRDLERLHIPLPPILEQHGIVAMLQEMQELHRLRAKSDSSTADVVLALFHHHFGAGADLPKCELQAHAEVVSGVAKGRRLNKDVAVQVPYLRVANVQAGHLDLTDLKTIEALPSEVVELALQDGDVVMTEGGDFDKLGRGALWEHDIPNCIHQNHVFRVRVDRRYLDPLFLVTYLQSADARGYFLRCAKKTTNLASINMGQLRRLPVPLPPIERQQQYCRDVREVRALQAQQQDSRKRLDELRESLLYRAFRGHLSVAHPVRITFPATAAMPLAVTSARDAIQACSYMTDAEIAASVIAELMARGRPLTEFFVQKHMFVLKHREGLPIVSEFRRKPAGPWSHDLKRKAFFSGTKHNWFSQADRTLTPGRSINAGVAKAREFLGDRFDRIAAVVADLTKFRDLGLERWTTVLKAALDLRDAGRLVTTNAIQAEIDAWGDKRDKEAFSEEGVDATVRKMLSKGWIKLDA